MAIAGGLQAAAPVVGVVADSVLKPVLNGLVQDVVGGLRDTIKSGWFKFKRSFHFRLGASRTKAYDRIATDVKAYANRLAQGDVQFLNTDYGVDQRVLDFFKNTTEFRTAMSDFIPGLDNAFQTGGQNLMLQYLFPNRAPNFFKERRSSIISNLKGWWLR